MKNMKKRVLLLLVITLIFVLFNAVAVYAEDERNYQTYYTSFFGDSAQVDCITRVTTHPQEPKAVFVIVQDKTTKRFYFAANAVNETQYVVAKDGLNARLFPNVLYDNVDRVLPYGAAVQLIGSGNGWAIIDKNGEFLFCWDEYLSDEKPKIEQKKKTITTTNSAIYSAADLRYQGVIHWGGWRWTWYSQNVLPGGGLNIPGRHVDSNGYVCDENGFICLASSVLSKGTIVETPFGKKGKIYDSGCAADTLDVYTNF